MTIPDTVEKLGDSAFYNCKSLTRVVIGNGVTSIGTLKESGKGVGVFEGCAALSDMTIGSGVTFICVRAFKGCANLTSISFRGTTGAWKSIEKGEDWIPTTGMWGPTKVALSQVVCNNGTLTGDDIG